MADDLQLLIHPDVQHKITNEAIHGMSERDPSESDGRVEVISTKTTKTRGPAAEFAHTRQAGNNRTQPRDYDGLVGRCRLIVPKPCRVAYGRVVDGG